MQVSSDELVAQFQRDWPKELEISYRRLENAKLQQRLRELEGTPLELERDDD